MERQKAKGVDNRMRTIYSGLLIIFVLPLFFVVSTSAAGRGAAAQKDESLRRGETRTTLDPNMFRDPQVRAAYRIAKEIPWVLDSIYCYCYCESSVGHISVLSCYVDTHAAMWGICQGEARRAYELYKKGYSVKKIKTMVEEEYRKQ